MCVCVNKMRYSFISNIHRLYVKTDQVLKYEIVSTNFKESES